MPTVRHLGQHSALPDHYDRSLLEAIPRQSSIDGVGYDVWHAYEVCALCEDGMPVQAIAKLCYERKSPSIVESKSLKLYLYSLANEKIGHTPSEVLQRLEATISKDLSTLLQTQVKCSLHTFYNDLTNPLNHYPLLETSTELLPVSDGELRIASHLLGSLCPVTGQPDWGTLVLHLAGENIPTRSELLSLLLAKRWERGFHEEICDELYTELIHQYMPRHLMLSCLYTRRGGIDICPVRATEVGIIPSHFIDVGTLSQPSFRR